MIDLRLDLALEGGLSLPGEGRIGVFNPPVEASLTALEKHDIEIVEGFKPAHDLWRSRGYACVVEPGDEYSAVIVSLPRAKADARAVIEQAVSRTSGLVVVDGQKTDGIDSILREMRKREPLEGPVVKAHGKLFWVQPASPAAFADWRAGPELTAGGFWTAPGVFSADAVDPASALLAQVLPNDLGKVVADLGAGWGFLSAHVLTRENVEAVHLVEAHYMALECARRNVSDPRACYHWEDARSWRPQDKLDAIVMNPPFHTGRAADPGLGQDFVQAAAQCLKPGGALWMVANRHLPYEESLATHFAQVAEIGGDARFKLFHATRPLRGKARRS